MDRSTPRCLPLFLAVPLLALLIAGCGGKHSPPLAPQSATDHAQLHLHADLAGTPAEKLAVTVTGSDLPTPVVFLVSSETRIAAGTLPLPTASARPVALAALEADGAVTHAGSSEIDVLPQGNPTHRIVLGPRNGGAASITARLGDWVVTIEPQNSELAVGQSVQLHATIVDED